MFTRQLIFSVVGNVATFAVLLFVAAGTVHWWRAWVLLAAIAIATVVVMVSVLRTRPGLLRERLKGGIQKGQPAIDRLIVLMFLSSYGISIVFIPLDVFWLHLLPKPPIWVSSLGFLLIICGWYIIALVFKENAFAAPIVKHQVERQHKVVDTGVYSIVRHPMYDGIFIFNVGAALWLESYAAALLTLVPAACLAVRILFEERFLLRVLPGYESYVQKVRYRLVPFVW